MPAFYEPGVYSVLVTRQGFTASQNGTPQFYLSFTVLSKNGQQVQQYERTHFRAITEKTMEYFVADMQSLGFRGDNLDQLNPESAVFAHSFVDAEILMRCDHESYQGEEKERWGIARQGGSFEARPVDSTRMRTLNALFGRAIKQTGVPVSAPKAQPQPAAVLAGDAPSDEDVPF